MRTMLVLVLLIAACKDEPSTDSEPERATVAPRAPAPPREPTISVEMGLDDAEARALANDVIKFCSGRTTRATWTRIESIAVSQRKWSGEDPVWELAIEPNRRDGPPMTYWVKLDRSAIASGPFGECGLGRGSISNPAYFPFEP